MSIERWWTSVSPQSITVNGTSDGHISVGNSTLFKVNQKVIIFSDTVTPLSLQVKQINNINDIEIGPIGNDTDDRADLASILTTDNPRISAPRQPRPTISREDIFRAMYAEEPTVAMRSHLVDELGRAFGTSNPLAVQLSDGSINIETLNAELRVQLSAKDDDPTAGDIHSSVRIGDGTNELKVEADGSINANIGAFPLPAGAATSALQVAGNASLASIDSKLTSPLSVIGPLTNTELRALPVPISGTIAATQSGAWTSGRTWTLSNGTDSVNVGNFPTTIGVTQDTSPWLISGTVAATQSGTWNINDVSGTISLPTGASTSALQTAGNALLTSIDSKLTSPLIVSGPLTDAQLRATAIPVSGTISAVQSGAWTVSLATESIEIGTVDQGTPAVIANAWPVLPTDGTNSQEYTVSGESKVLVTPLTNSSVVKVQLQDNSGSAITLGQALMAVSIPVVIASNQSAIPVSATIPGSVSVTQGTSPWVVSGTVAATQSGTWNINNVSGTISLPTGAATAANQATEIASLASIDSKLTSPLTVTGPLTDIQLRATSVPISGTVSAAQSGSWTTGRTWVLSSGTDSVNIGNFPATVAVTQSTSPWVVSGTVAATQSGTWNITNISGTVSLPTGAATAANQATEIASLASIDSKLTSPITVTGPLTDTQLRATPVPISGTVTANIGTTGGLALDTTVAALQVAQGSTTSGESGSLVQGAVTTAAPSYTTGKTNPLSLTTVGNLRVDGSSVTQPISAASLPLPSGASTSALQTTINTTLGSPFQAGGSIGNTSFGATQATAANLNATVVTTGGATVAKDSSLATINTTLGSPMQNSGGSVTANAGTNLNTSLLALESGGHLASIDTKIPSNLTVTSTRLLVDGSGVTQPISAASLPLPTGASTSALQTTGNTSLSNIDGKLNSLGQKVMTGSVPVVLASDQGPLPLTKDNTSTFSFTANSQTLDIDCSGLSTIRFQISGTWIGTISFLQTTDGTNFENSKFIIDENNPFGADQNALEFSTTINVTGRILVTGFKTFRLQTTAWTSGTAAVTAIGSSNPSMLTSVGSTVVGGEVTANQGLSGATPWLTDVTHFGSNPISTGTGTSGSGIPRVTVSNDSNILARLKDGAGTSLTSTLVSAKQALDVNLVNSSVTVSGTVTANAGTNLNTSLLALESGGNLASIKSDVDNLSLAQASTTAGQLGNLILTATTTNAPTYVTAKSNPLSTDTSGNLRISLKDSPANTNKFLVTADAITFASPQHVIVDSGSTSISGSVAITEADGANVTLGAKADAKSIATDTTAVSIMSVLKQISASVQAPPSQAVTNAGTFAVQATLSAETTKVIGTVNIAASQTIGISAGSAVIGHVIVDSGTLTSITNVVHVDDNSGSLTVDNSGTFAVQATIAASATNIAKAEDTASADADVGVPAMAIRKATPANSSSTDGDYEMLQMSAGRLWTSSVIDSALPAGTNVIGHVIIDSGSTTAVTGNVATTIADAADVTFGAKADAKNTATDTTPISAMSILKQISASVQAPPSQAVTNAGTFAVQATLAAETTKVIGTVNSVQSGTWNVVQPDTTTSGTITTTQSVTLAVTGLGTVGVQPTGTWTGTIIFEGSFDGGTTYNPINFVSVTTGLQIASISFNISGLISCAGFSHVRARGNTVSSGTATINFRGNINSTTLTTNQGISLNGINGNLPVTGNGVTGIGSQRVTIASDNTAFSVNATPPALTKGTQGSTGYSVQDIKDAGRTSLSFYATNIASGLTTAETAITLNKSAGTSATTSAASFVITNGKKFRITCIVVTTRANVTATAQSTLFNIRLNTAGAVTTSSTPVLFSVRSDTPATANAVDRVTLEIPDGYEILGDGTLQFGITAASTYVTNAPTWDVNIIGFEY